MQPPSQTPAERERALLTLVDALLRELRAAQTPPPVLPTSRLEQDLGVDSLARTELNARIERRFGVRLPLDAVSQAETVADLLAALEHGAPDIGGTGARAPLLEPLPPAQNPVQAQTLIEVLEWRVARQPERLHLTLLQDDRTELGALTYDELAARARRLAAGLIARDISPGDRVAIMLPTSLDFFIVFFGILYAGATPVPIYPPMRLSQIEEHLKRQAGILRNAGARLLVTLPEGLPFAALLRGQVETLESVETAAGLAATAETMLPTVRATDMALIQYTSGSTGDPKGVVLTHANLLANVRAMGKTIDAKSSDVFVSWLPLYHDMGLIGAWLGSLYYAAHFFVMSPLAFLARPANWLWTIHRTRATLSAAPNFAFELCVNRIDDDSLAGLDLSSLRMVANGAEPVSVSTLRRFCKRFEAHGLRRDAIAPVYGLAESAVGLAFPPSARAPIIDRVDRDALTLKGQAAPATAEAKAIEFVACGQALEGHEIRIIDAGNRELGERREGRLEFRGPSATSGYFRNEEKTRALIRDGWLDSGDRAYVANGDVFITGRIKDIVIRAGRHLYPQEIEEAVGLVPGVRKGCVAAFGALDPRSGTERLVVLAETAERDPAARARIMATAQEIVRDISGAIADEIVLAPPRSAPKTSSGKIRRSAAKALYEKGAIGAAGPPVWRQLARLALAGVTAKLRRVFAGAGALLYAVWWWLVVSLGYAIVFLGVMTLPTLRLRWALVNRVARVTLRALGAAPQVVGVEHIPMRSAALVFNHESYADAILLAAALPGEPAFIAKKELSRQIFAGPFLRRLGALFVERFDVAGSLADVEALTGAARGGRNLVFFPEGTFTRRPGLAGFYLGAFKIAAEGGLVIVPGAIRGTRSMLRAGQWFPRHSALGVDIAPPIEPRSVRFEEVLRLRDAARRVILDRCQEPDLDQLTKPR
jgi:1-acyl-sn-glycerol-3-phosphate acyltransferase